MELSAWLTYLIATIVLSVTPGPGDTHRMIVAMK